MNPSDRLGRILQQGPVIPVISIKNPEDAVPLAKALVAGGCHVLEITLRTAAAAEAAKRIQGEVPDAIVGLGTVVNASHFDLAEEIGVSFVVSPGLSPDLVERASGSDMPFLPGVMTPTEIISAYHHGFRLLKLFPAAIAGGVGMLKSLAGPFSEISFCPTGGISPDNVNEYLALNNVICVGGSWLARSDLIKEKDWDAITALSAQASKFLK